MSYIVLGFVSFVLCLTFYAWGKKHGFEDGFLKGEAFGKELGKRLYGNLINRPLAERAIGLLQELEANNKPPKKRGHPSGFKNNVVNKTTKK